MTITTSPFFYFIFNFNCLVYKPIHAIQVRYIISTCSKYKEDSRASSLGFCFTLWLQNPEKIMKTFF